MTAHNELYAPLAQLAVPIMHRYTDRHGYDLIVGEYHDRPENDPATRLSRGDLCKADMFLRLYDEYEVLMWLDIDSVIMNHEVKIEDALGLRSWLWTYDQSGPLSGFWIARTKPIIRQWVKRFAFATAYEYGGGDQYGMRAVMTWPPYASEVLGENCVCGKNAGHTFPAEFVDEDCREMSAYEPGDWIITFPARPLDERVRLMAEHAAHVAF